MLSDVRKMKLRKSVFIFLQILKHRFEKFKARRQLLMKLKKLGLDSAGYYDQEICGGSDSRFAGYVTSIAATELEDVVS